MGTVLAGLLWLGAASFVLGLGYRVRVYLRAADALPIPLTPAPRTRAGVVLRLLAELVLFRSLYRADKAAWGLGWLFHWSLLAVGLRHLWLFTDPPWFAAGWLFALDPWPALTLVASAAALLARRALHPRVRYVSAPSDYLWPVVFMVLGATGLTLGGGADIDLAAVRRFTLALLRLEAAALPASVLLAAHLLLASAVLGVFAFSKLMHAPGVLFSPTWNRRDNARNRPG